MEIPLRIVTRGLRLSLDALTALQQDVERLGTFFAPILSCEVHVEGPGPHHRQGDTQVRMVVGVPGRDIIISRQKGGRVQDALANAFRAAGRRLEDHARRLRGEVKRHATEPGFP